MDTTSAAQHSAEVAAGSRFHFGENWRQFLTHLNETRIAQAETSLRKFLEQDRLDGLTFLDIGSGSGLFSLAARRLGAKVFSFDYDPQSFGCTEHLRNKYFPGDANWHVEQGSALDRDYVKSLGQFDIVYSWGVLHHTGHMWDAIDNAMQCVRPGGRCFIAIYNDQGVVSKRWLWVKQTFCKSSRPVQLLMLAYFFVALNWKPAVKGLLRGRPLEFWTGYDSSRGMNLWRDLEDWVGGLPFEVASSGELLAFFRKRGFTLETLETTNTLGCNQLVFRKQA